MKEEIIITTLFKKIDKLLLGGFWPPFILAFGLVMFVFTMQSMWKFVDDIIGKGASAAMVIEFISYLSIGLIPLALPAAVLLASLYMMGNMSEKYELTAMKSAGVSLWRIMRGLLLASMTIGVFSFICANYIAPQANLKFHTRLMSFKSQKLALSLGEGVFNDDFQNYSIRIGEKEEGSGIIRDIMLYDHSSENRNRTKIILADNGRMDMETDDRYLIMRLNDGRQYQEMEESPHGKKGKPRSYPYLRIHFGELEKYMDLKEFDMKDTDEELFKKQEEMMSVRQLKYEMDTMQDKITEQYGYMGKIIRSYFHFVKKSDSTSYYVPLSAIQDMEHKDILHQKQTRLPVLQTQPEPQSRPSPPKTLERPSRPNAPQGTYQPLPQREREKAAEEDKVIRQKLSGKPAKFQEIFLPEHLTQITGRASSAAKAIHNKAENAVKKTKLLKDKKGRYTFQIHLKFSLALACVIFLLIGAPLGAITRKGGVGYPILIGTVLFMLFVVLVTMCEKMFENGTIGDPVVAAWLPAVIYAIPCFFLTRGAVRDAKAMNTEFLEVWVRKWRIWKWVT